MSQTLMPNDGDINRSCVCMELELCGRMIGGLNKIKSTITGSSEEQEVVFHVLNHITIRIEGDDVMIIFGK